ncbi:MAG: AAA family ATPase [bacterium]|nr:AAA family ATPase [bacterium]
MNELAAQSEPVQTQQTSEKPVARVISIVNQKGGVGKTTSAINLAASLAHLGKKVILIDVDSQGNASSGLGVAKNEVEGTVFDVLVDRAPLAEILQPTPLETLKVAPANSDLLSAELHLGGQEDGKKRLSQAVIDFFAHAPHELHPEFIVIDCPPSLALLTINAILTSDSLLIPVQCEYYALEGLTDIMSSATLLRQSFNPSLSLEGILLTMADRRLNLSHQVETEIRQVYADFVFQNVIYRSVRLSEAPSHGLPILQYDPESSGAKAYLGVAEEIIQNEAKSPRPWPFRAAV